MSNLTFFSLILAKLAAIGLVSGPFGHYWYNYLDRRFKTRTTKDVLMKILYDQAIGAPIFNVLFIYGTHTLDGKHISLITEIFKEKFLTIYAVSHSFHVLFNSYVSHLLTDNKY